MCPLANVCYKSVRYIEVFLWEFNRDSAGWGSGGGAMAEDFTNFPQKSLLSRGS